MIADIKPLSDRKEEILREAQQLFSQKGYATASMRDLAAALGIKPASLYSNFSSKEEMLWEIALRCARDFFEAIDPIEAESLPVKVRLKKMLEAHIEVVIRNLDASAIFFKEWRNLGPEKRSLYAELQRSYEKKFVEVVEVGVEKGEFKGLNTSFVVFTLLGASNWLTRWYRPGQEAQIKHELTTLLLDGLYE